MGEELYKESKYLTRKLIKENEKKFYKEKSRENFGKTKELWGGKKVKKRFNLDHLSKKG